jgi:hypothetical protein
VYPELEVGASTEVTVQQQGASAEAVQLASPLAAASPSPEVTSASPADQIREAPAGEQVVKRGAWGWRRQGSGTGQEG